MELLTGTFGVIISLFLFVLGIVWMLFPFLVVSRLDKLVKLAEAANRANANQATAPVGSPRITKPDTSGIDPDIAEHLARKAARGGTVSSIALLFLAMAAPLAAQSSKPLQPLSVSLNVTVDQIDAKGTTWKTEWGSYNKITAFARVLRIQAKTTQADAAPDVVLKYAFIGWDVGGKSTIVYDSGNKPFTVAGGHGSQTVVVSGVQQSRDDKYVMLEQRYRSGIQPRGWLVMIEQAGRPIAVQSSTPEMKDWLRKEIVAGRASFDNATPALASSP